ncbi:hypothetical protein BGX28_008028 [Mortierella sp. GBA30]|nr:hypothetical protein BGX28_008028 [Mortierella sp. GBA30]
MPPPKGPPVNGTTHAYPSAGSLTQSTANTSIINSNNNPHRLSQQSQPVSSATTAPDSAPKKRTHKGTEKKRRKEGTRDGEAGEKKAQVNACDTCKEAHRKCNGLEPCVSCEAASIQCTYNTLNPTKKKAHDAYVLMKKQEHNQRLKCADVIVARMGQLDIAGTDTNFGPILAQVINLPRYEPPPSNFENDHERLLDIGPVEQLLIDCYFKHFNYYLPILNRKIFMEQVRDPEQLKTLEVQKLLACVLATGFAFRQEIGDPSAINKMEPNYGTGMCRKFHHFNTHDVFNSSIENCQCYLVLTGFYSSVTNYDAVHNLVALAHSIAAGQGLNRNKGLYYQMPYKGKEHTADSIEMGHRIYWTVVIVCSSYSLSHQSPFITSNDYDIAFPARQISDQCPDFQGVMQDEFEGIKDLQYFVPMYEITSRVADITCTSTRQRPHHKVDEVREMLNEWRTKTLPPHLRVTPTDMDAIKRQSRFSKLYHASCYMFDICLHHTFQLHESHRELGIHGIWSAFCYDAAIGIKNIYSTRPMTRMNSHVILPVAAGAFANIVASKVFGKEESAQKFCDEIKVMLAAIVRASSSIERDRLSKYVGHGYAGVTQNVTGPVESFVIPVPESPPMNELSSPPHTTASSPEESTDVIGDTDGDLSEEEEEVDDDEEDIDNQDKRMSGFIVPVNGLHSASQQTYQSQHRPHPSMTSRTDLSQTYGQIRHVPEQDMRQHLQQQYDPQTLQDSRANGHSQQGRHQQQQHDLNNYASQGHNNIMPQMGAGPSPAAHHTGVSSSFTGPNVSETYANRSRHQEQQQQHSTYSSTVNGHTQNGNNTALSSAGPNMFSTVTTVALDEVENGLVTDFDLAQEYGPRFFVEQQFNEAQLTKLSEYRALLTNNHFTQEQYQQIEIELQYQLNALATDDPIVTSASSASHHQHHQQSGGFSGGYQQQSQSQPFIQQQQQQHATYPAIDTSATISLKDSRLLSGGLEGLGSMPDMSSTIASLGFSAGDFSPESHLQQQQRFYQTPTLTSTVSSTDKSFSTSSDLASPVSATSSNHPSHQQSLTSMSSVSSNNAAAFGGMIGYPQTNQSQQQQQQQQQKAMDSIHGVDARLTGDVNVHTMNMPFPTSTSGLDYAEHGLLMYDPSMTGTSLDAVVVGSGVGLGDSVVVGGPGEEDSLMGFINDPDMMLKSQIFSRVASNSMISQSSPPQHQKQQQQQHHHHPSQQQQQQQQQQQYPLSYH